MIELKLSQGAKPGHGGVLPAAKVTPEIAAAAACRWARTASRPPRIQRSRRRIELMQFIGRLRELSGGKPAGFKLCIGHPWEFLRIVKAMLETGITPDFIVVDGKEGGTGAAPLEFIDHVGMPLREGLLLRAQRAGRRWAARPHQDRLRRQDRQRLRHGARHGARRRLVQRGARLHVRARLHPGADLPHRPLPDRRRHAGPACASGRWWCPTRPSACSTSTSNTLHALEELVQAAGLHAPARHHGAPHRAPREPERRAPARHPAARSACRRAAAREHRRPAQRVQPTTGRRRGPISSAVDTSAALRATPEGRHWPSGEAARRCPDRIQVAALGGAGAFKADAYCAASASATRPIRSSGNASFKGNDRLPLGPR